MCHSLFSMDIIAAEPPMQPRIPTTTWMGIGPAIVCSRQPRQDCGCDANTQSNVGPLTARAVSSRSAHACRPRQLLSLPGSSPATRACSRELHNPPLGLCTKHLRFPAAGPLQCHCSCAQTPYGCSAPHSPPALPRAAPSRPLGRKRPKALSRGATRTVRATATTQQRRRGCLYLPGSVLPSITPASSRTPRPHPAWRMHETGPLRCL